MDRNEAAIQFPMWRVAWLFDTSGRDADAGSMVPRSRPRGECTPAIIAGVRDGNVTAFERLYTILYPRVLRTARRYSDSLAAAEDMVHDAFLSLWDHRSSLNVQQDVGLYLLTSVRNRAFNATRHQKYVSHVEEAMSLSGGESPPGMSEGAENVFDRIEADSVQSALLHAVDTLPELQRRVITLRWRTTMSYDAIAVELGITQKMVRLNLDRAYAALRPLLRHLVGAS